MRTLPSGGARDQAIIAHILPLAEPHPAADLGTLITHAAERRSRLRATLAQWRASDPFAAHAWLSRSNLDAVLKSQLLSALR